MGAVFVATVVDMIVRATHIWQDPFGSFTEAENPAELIVLLFLIVAALVDQRRRRGGEIRPVGG